MRKHVFRFAISYRPLAADVDGDADAVGVCETVTDGAGLGGDVCTTLVRMNHGTAANTAIGTMNATSFVSVLPRFSSGGGAEGESRSSSSKWMRSSGGRSSSIGDNHNARDGISRGR